MRSALLPSLLPVLWLLACAHTFAQSEEAETLGVCEVNANPDRYLNQEVTVRGRLVGTAHGTYTYLPECPKIYQAVSVANDVPDDVLQTFQAVSLRIIEPSDQVYVFTAKPEMRNVRLWGTPDSYDRLVLMITEIEPKHKYR